MKKLTLLILSILISVSVFSQDFEYGYFINLKGDTIKGYLSFEESPDIYEKFYFKKTTDDKSLKITTNKALAFYYYNTNSCYRTMKYNYKIERGEQVTELYFAKLILKGYTNLYKLKFKTNPYRKRVEKVSSAFDGQNTFTYFLLKEGKEYQLELEESNYYKKEGDAIPSGVRKHKRYLTQLFIAFSDCPKVQKKLEKTNFNDKSLTKIVTTYNNCKKPNSENILFLKEKEPASIAFMGIGFSSHSLAGNGIGANVLLNSRLKNRRLGINVMSELGIIPKTEITNIFSGYLSIKSGGQVVLFQNENIVIHSFLYFGLRWRYEPKVIRGYSVIPSIDSELGAGLIYKEIRFDTYISSFSYGGRVSFRL
jgi:hypothetical protein